MFLKTAIRKELKGFVIGVVAKASGEPGSSVSIVSGYGLDDQAIEVRSSAEARGFFL
jgi:hypothetical protein